MCISWVFTGEWPTVNGRCPARRTTVSGDSPRRSPILVHSSMLGLESPLTILATCEWDTLSRQANSLMDHPLSSRRSLNQCASLSLIMHQYIKQLSLFGGQYVPQHLTTQHKPGILSYKRGQNGLSEGTPMTRRPIEQDLKAHLLDLFIGHISSDLTATVSRLGEIAAADMEMTVRRRDVIRALKELVRSLGEAIEELQSGPHLGILATDISAMWQARWRDRQDSGGREAGSGATPGGEGK